ncbi:hypothetical protein GO755_33135 [Spirosoma sp. HMF4905]|uniref:Linear amide C-N hydrolase n=1 Tax=Spirosoma arboris TaxID=2682092 RepID=A0A7K1SM88_9BACT|nr:hypothetical protein [Spirosoma arboris]MVM34920.1 hypothetical protein [Spirosoma arboris]
MKTRLSIVSVCGLCWLLLGAVNYTSACTIFVLTDARRTLFFNNEDYSNPATRMWFLPAEKGYYGCAYVGFDDGWAQGGVNTKGLAFDWVAGFDEEWTPTSAMKRVQGNPSERMLETCATVDEAIAFYQKNLEPSFSNAKILIADNTGASVIIGATNGKLHVDRSNQSRGFGYGGQTLSKLLSAAPEPTLANGIPILQACLQEGMYATKYSTVYDLRAGELSLISFANQQDEVKLNLAKELSKGGHYYKIPEIRQELAQAPVPLLPLMKRFLWDDYPPIANSDPAITKRIRTILENVAMGRLQEEDFTPEFWKGISAAQKDSQAELAKLGKLLTLTLLERQQAAHQSSYLYCVDFENATVLQRFTLDDQNRVAMIQSEAAEQKNELKKREK